MTERGESERANAPDDGRVQSAEYIADLAAELAKLARRSRLDVLAYLLDIANLEARTISGRAAETPRRRRDKVARVQG